MSHYSILSPNQSIQVGCKPLTSQICKVDLNPISNSKGNDCIWGDIGVAPSKEKMVKIIYIHVQKGQKRTRWD